MVGDLRQKRVTVTSAADGTGHADFPMLRGAVVLIAYTKVDFENGVAITVTNLTTGEVVLSKSTNATAQYSPRRTAHNYLGAALSTDVGVVPFTLVNDILRVAVTSAGSSVHTGIFDLTVI